MPKGSAAEETKGVGMDFLTYASSKSTNDNSGNMMSNNNHASK